MPAGRPKAITKEIEETIAELFFLAFTDDQVAFFTGVNVRTIARARAGGFCHAIKRGEMARECTYRQKIWDGREGWQGAAWFFERKYPTQFAKPEIQLAITNNTLNQTNNVLVIQAEVAGQIKTRVKTAEAKIDQLLKDKGRGNGNGNSHPEAIK